MIRRTWQDDVEEFHRGTGLTVGHYPKVRDAETRARLIAEEAVETINALGFDADVVVSRVTGDVPWTTVGEWHTQARPSLPDVADGITDLIYVALGAAVACGLDIAPIWNAVHRANMAKIDGGYRDENGKWRKPAGWTAPDVEREVALQAIQRADLMGVSFEVEPSGAIRLLFAEEEVAS